MSVAGSPHVAWVTAVRIVATRAGPCGAPRAAASLQTARSRQTSRHEDASANGGADQGGWTEPAVRDPDAGVAIERSVRPIAGHSRQSTVRDFDERRA